MRCSQHGNGQCLDLDIGLDITNNIDKCMKWTEDDVLLSRSGFNKECRDYQRKMAETV